MSDNIYPIVIQRIIWEYLDPNCSCSIEPADCMSFGIAHSHKCICNIMALRYRTWFNTLFVRDIPAKLRPLPGWQDTTNIIRKTCRGDSHGCICGELHGRIPCLSLDNHRCICLWDEPSKCLSDKHHCVCNRWKTRHACRRSSNHKCSCRMGLGKYHCNAEHNHKCVCKYHDWCNNTQQHICICGHPWRTCKATQHKHA